MSVKNKINDMEGAYENNKEIKKKFKKKGILKKKKKPKFKKNKHKN